MEFPQKYLNGEVTIWPNIMKFTESISQGHYLKFPLLSFALELWT